jgi:hypothetical protein
VFAALDCPILIHSTTPQKMHVSSLQALRHAVACASGRPEKNPNAGFRFLLTIIAVP